MLPSPGKTAEISTLTKFFDKPSLESFEKLQNLDWTQLKLDTHLDQIIWFKDLVFSAQVRLTVLLPAPRKFYWGVADGEENYQFGNFSVKICVLNLIPHRRAAWDPIPGGRKIHMAKIEESGKFTHSLFWCESGKAWPEDFKKEYPNPQGLIAWLNKPQRLQNDPQFQKQKKPKEIPRPRAIWE